MTTEELYEGIDDVQSITQRYLGLSLRKFFILLSIVLALGIYIGIILYGTNSIEVLFNLQEYEQYLKSEIVNLKNENADLQKEYFELKEISAQ
jgi:cell division protein FtsB